MSIHRQWNDTKHQQEEARPKRILRARRAWWASGVVMTAAAAMWGLATPSYGASSEPQSLARTTLTAAPVSHRGAPGTASSVASMQPAQTSHPPADGAASPAHTATSEHAPHGGVTSVKRRASANTAGVHRTAVSARTSAGWRCPLTRTAPRGHSNSDLYWLARVIEAEAGAEPMSAKIAVGDVVMNRVHSPDYPNTVKGVIFQIDHGYYAFTSVMNGWIYQVTPSTDSLRAAREVLEQHVNIVPGAVVFYNGACTPGSSWVRTRPVITTFGKLTFAH